MRLFQLLASVALLRAMDSIAYRELTLDFAKFADIANASYVMMTIRG